MRNLTILLALIFSALFSSTSFAEWKKVSSSGGGANTFYVDFERIRKHGGFVYYWMLSDYLKPTKQGDFSGKTYIQGDCDDIFFKLFRYKYLSASFHKEPMGRGTPSTTYKPKNPEWKIPSPNSSVETILKKVCAYAK